MKVVAYKQKLSFLLALCLLMVTLPLYASGGTDNTSSYVGESDSVNAQQNWYQHYQPFHTYKWSEPRDLFNQIYDFINAANSTWTVASSSTGKLMWQCPSFGYPIPATSQLTNPMVAQTGGSGSSYWGVAIPQPEPDGLYSPTAGTGTWVVCVRVGGPDEGQLYPVYDESVDTTFPFPVVQAADGSWVAAATYNGKAVTASAHLANNTATANKIPPYDPNNKLGAGTPTSGH